MHHYTEHLTGEKLTRSEVVRKKSNEERLRNVKYQQLKNQYSSSVNSITVDPYHQRKLSMQLNTVSGEQIDPNSTSNQWKEFTGFVNRGDRVKSRPHGTTQ